MSFSEKLIQIRKEAGYTQQQLAVRSGISQQAISKLEKGRSSPSEYTMRQLASGLNMPLSALIDEDAEVPPRPGNPLVHRIYQRIENLSEPALLRLSDFIDGFETAQKIAESAASYTAEEPENPSPSAPENGRGESCPGKGT